MRRATTSSLQLLVLLAIVAYALLPLYWIFISAVRPVGELLRIPPGWLPGGISLSSFRDVWTAIPLGHYMLNSLLVSLMTAAIAVTISTLAAYGLVRFSFRGRTFVVFAVLFTVTIPTVVTLVPLYSLLTDIGFTEHRFGLAFSYSAWAIPFTTLLLRGYFQNSYPVDVEEAALIDGCSRFSVLWHVMLPLSRPGLVSATIFTVLLSWNEFIWASVITTGESVRTASVGLQQFVGQFQANQNLALWMAGSLCMSIPLIVLFLAVQRWFTTAYGGSVS
jgi:ABC-type glycerol-3-phosphate transport system permease component